MYSSSMKNQEQGSALENDELNASSKIYSYNMPRKRETNIYNDVENIKIYVTLRKDENDKLEL